MKVGDEVICIVNHECNSTPVGVELEGEVVEIVSNGIIIRWKNIDYDIYYPDYDIKTFMERKSKLSTEDRLKSIEPGQ